MVSDTVSTISFTGRVLIVESLASGLCVLSRAMTT
jgi:hypothetical protein